MACRPLCVGCLLVSFPTGTRQGSRRHQAGRRGRPPPSKKRRGSHRHQAGRRGSSGRALRLSPVRSKLRRRRPSTPSKSSPPSRETPLPLSSTSSSADSRREAAPREVGGLVLQAAGAGGDGCGPPPWGSGTRRQCWSSWRQRRRRCSRVNRRHQAFRPESFTATAAEPLWCDVLAVSFDGGHARAGGRSLRCCRGAGRLLRWKGIRTEPIFSVTARPA
jgi:hypothetical protein